MASVGVGVDVLVTVHEKVTTGKRGWHKVVGTGNVARKGCESVPTTKRVGVVVRTLELGKRAMVVMCLALLWILNLQKNRQSKIGQNCNLKQQVLGNCQEDDYAL